MESDRLNVGVIGCGAVSELLHLPALTKLPSVTIYALVDKNEERARAMAEKFCLSRYCTNYEDLYENIDIALIALPNNLHSKPSIDFLNRNVNVLCEKPMATSVTECISMIDANEKSKAKLMIGHNKRFMSNVVLAKKMIEDGTLGDIVDYNCEAGAKFKWPTQTGFYFEKEKAGGGVLIDMGVHVIDLLLWFFGNVKEVQYKGEDTLGKGVEDKASLSLTHKNSVIGKLTLSRTELLANKMLVTGKQGQVKIDIFDTTFFEFNSKKSKISRELGQIDVKTKNNNPYRDQFEYFVKCIKSNKKPLISGVEGMKVIEVVENCYKHSL